MQASPEVVALHAAIKEQRYDAVMEILARKEINPNAPLGNTSALAAATKVGNREVCAALLNAGADANFGGRSGRFPLYIAAHKGNMEILSLLLEWGADINMKYVTGNTPLLEAAAKGHGPMVPYLLNAGANPMVYNNAGETGLHLAAGRANLEHMKLFLEAGVNVSSSKSLPMQKGYSKNRNGTNDTEKNPNEVPGFTPLHLAVYGASTKHYDAVKLLLDHGAMIDAQLPNGRTPLHIAAMRNAVEIAGLLLSYNCEVDPVSMENEEHKTPLMKAVDAGHLKMVEILIDVGADVNFSNHWGCPSLITAIFNGKVGIVQALIRAGCEINLASRGVISPFQASLRHPPHMTQMLVLAGYHLGPEVSAMLDVPEDNKLYNAYPDVRDWILDLINNPKSLQQLCRETIRDLLPNMTHFKVRCLNIPQRLADYLDLSDFEDLQSLYQELDAESMVASET